MDAAEKKKVKRVRNGPDEMPKQKGKASNIGSAEAWQRRKGRTNQPVALRAGGRSL